MESLVIRPDHVRRASDGSADNSAWKKQVIGYIEQAAAAGQSVTLESQEKLFTPAEASELLGISRATISRRISSGAIRAVKVGSHNRIPYIELERFWRQERGELVEFVADDIWRDVAS